MSAEFFSNIGDSLISIKNSPFYRLGQLPQNRDPNLLRSELSYDPNRVFNVEKYEEGRRGIEEPDMVEALREEAREHERIEF
jgi:hypothetical protein